MMCRGGEGGVYYHSGVEGGVGFYSRGGGWCLSLGWVGVDRVQGIRGYLNAERGYGRKGRCVERDLEG